MTPAEIARQMYADYDAGNLSAVLERLHDDFAFIRPVDQRYIRHSGVVRGVEAFTGAIVRLQEDLEFHEFRPIDMIEAEDRVAARIEMKLTRKRDQEKIAVSAAHFLTFKDSKLLQLIEYYDTALVAGVKTG